MSAIIGRVVGAAGFAYHRTLRFARRGRWPLTIGVRMIVCDGADLVLLVKHTYTPGWHFPGGAIDPRETAAEAAVRELKEEALMAPLTAPAFFGLYLSLTENKSDHIAVFTADSWQQISGNPRPLEIAEARFFPIRDLPKGTTGGTRRRIAEFLGEAGRSAHW